MKELVLGAAR
jgi:hypothetical protein